MALLNLIKNKKSLSASVREKGGLRFFGSFRFGLCLKKKTKKKDKKASKRRRSWEGEVSAQEKNGCLPQQKKKKRLRKSRGAA